MSAVWPAKIPRIGLFLRARRRMLYHYIQKKKGAACERPAVEHAWRASSDRWIATLSRVAFGRVQPPSGKSRDRNSTGLASFLDCKRAVPLASSCAAAEHMGAKLPRRPPHQSARINTRNRWACHLLRAPAKAVEFSTSGGPKIRCLTVCHERGIFRDDFQQEVHDCPHVGRTAQIPMHGHPDVSRKRFAVVGEALQIRTGIGQETR